MSCGIGAVGGRDQLAHDVSGGGCGFGGWRIGAVRWRMADPARRARTFEELYAEIVRLPEGMTGEILEDDVVRVMSRPGKRHRRATGGCLDALSGANANLRGSGWWIEVETEIRFPAGRLAVPELAGWRVERVPDLPDENPLTVRPD